MDEDLPKLKKVRGRTEAPTKPDFFDDALIRIGGKNPFGETMLRVDWGWDCRTFRKGDPEALAYPGPFLDRWILQRWYAPEFFGSKRHWEEFRYMKVTGGAPVDLLGEFPSRGRYGMVMPLTTADGDFIPLGSAVLQFIDRMQSEFHARPLNVYSDAKLYARLQKQMDEEQRQLDAEDNQEAAEAADYLGRQLDLNRNPIFLLPTGNSIWTPEGEHQIH